MKVILLAVVILGIGILGMAFNMVFRKKRFPETHVGHNKEMSKRGIVCAKTMDRQEQAKVKEQINFKNIRIAKS